MITTDAKLSDFLTREQAAKFLGVSRQRIHTLIHHGKLATVPFGRQKFVTRESAVARKKASAKAGSKKDSGK